MQLGQLLLGTKASKDYKELKKIHCSFHVIGLISFV